MTERMDHAKIAQNNLDHVHGRSLTFEAATVTVTAAQVHATLALVEQQRIANLIALGEATFPDGSRLYSRAVVEPSEQVESYRIRTEVREGLGL